MEPSSTPQNPYLAAPSEEWVTAQAVPTNQPRWRTTLAIIAMVLGTMGFANGGLSLLGVLFGGQLQKAFMAPSMAQGRGNNPAAAEMDAIMRRYQQDLIAVQEENWIPNIILAILHIVSGVLLFWGALSVLSKFNHGNAWLRSACQFAVVFEVGRVILATYIVFETKPVIERFFTDFMRVGQANAPAGTNELMRTTMTVSLYVGIAIQWIFMLIKSTFYSITAVYFGRLIKAEKEAASNPAPIVTT